LIIKRDARTLDKGSKLSLQRHLQKVVNAAQLSFANGVLQQNQIQFLIKINSEAKVRRSTKSAVLAKGEGKVMSFEDLEAARTARAVKEQARAQAKAKRGRKRKGLAENDFLGGEEAGTLEPRTKAARVETARVSGLETVPECRALVARMW